MSQLLDRLWTFFSSVRLAVGIFSLLIITTLLGSLILQRPIAEPGQMERVYSPETIRWLEWIGFTDVFHAWWYLLLLLLLAVNLTVASIDIWPRFRRRTLSFDPFASEDSLPQPVYRVPHGGSPEELTPHLSRLIARKFRRPVVQRGGDRHLLGAQSGRLAHLGVYVIHAGIILILIGGMIGAWRGFEGQIQLSPGDETQFYFDRREPGKRVPIGFTVRCQDARVEFHPDGTPKAYFSDLEILEEGKVVVAKTIRVNEPLRHKGISFYQATFGQKPVDEKTIFHLTLTDRKTGRREAIVIDPREEGVFGRVKIQVTNYLPEFPFEIEGHRRNLGESLQVSLSEGGEPPESIWLFREFPDFDRKTRQGRYALSFNRFERDFRVQNVTGIQVARNPGISLTWFGSSLLLAGLLATFLIPHRKLWVHVTNSEILVAGTSHRHPETFARKVKRIIGEIHDTLGRQYHSA
jgi:cytochrome c biogenesis protein